MDAHKKFGGGFPSGDKVQELRDVLKGQKNHEEEIMNDATDTDIQVNTAEQDELKAQVETLTQNLAKAQLEAMQNKEELLRTVADFDNTRKRLKKESEELAKFANEKLLGEFLPIIDSLEMSVTHIKDGDNSPVVEGVRLTLKQFVATLEKFGLTEINGYGEPFDPNTQEAIGTEPTNEVAEGFVARVHRKGYRLHGRVIRPAMVSVAAALN